MRIWIASVLISTQVLAGEVNLRRICPNVTDDGRALLASINGLKDQLRNIPECKPLTDKVNAISDVITKPKWKEIKAMLNNNGTAELVGEDIDTMAKLVNEASNAVAETVGQLSGSISSCVPKEKRASFLSGLAGITREVSSLASGLTGPYGYAISIAGGVLTTTLSGIDQLFKKNKVYNFDNIDEELLFQNQFCSFADLQEQLNEYEHLKEKPAELDNLVNRYLTLKIKELGEQCPECDGYRRAWHANESANRIISRIAADVEVQSIPANPSQRITFSRCNEIQRALHNENSDFAQYVRLLENYTNPHQSKDDAETIQKVVANYKLAKNSFLSLEECTKNPYEASMRFNDFIRDEVIRFNGTIFQQQMAVFRNRANDKYQSKLGDSIYKSVEAVKWALREKTRVENKLREPNYDIDREALLRQRNILHKRMVDQLMPPYLQFKFKRTREEADRFMSDFNKFKKRELRYFNSRLNIKATNLADLLIELTKNKTEARTFTSTYVRVFNQAQIVTLSIENNDRLCGYLVFTRTLTSKNRDLCTRNLDSLESDLIDFTLKDPEVKALEEFETWAVNNDLDIQSTYVMDYAERIREWTERGSERWELRSTPQNTYLEIISRIIEGKEPVR